MIPEQKDMWNKKHSAGEHDWFADEPSPLAKQLAKRLNKGERILEIGCGNGRDARYFADLGYVVTATDFSEVAITKNDKANELKNLTYKVQDVREVLPYSDESFEAVYSSLALHYYSDEMTRKIFSEIHRVLKANGIVAFSCKTYDKVRMNDAEQVEKDIFVDKNGHVLHAFSEDYVQELCKGLFEIEMIKSKDEDYGGRVSTVVSCIARKK